MTHLSDLIATDIDEYLSQHERKELLRFLTCGSVDDGKSTLIGRLFFDTKMIAIDTLEALMKDSVTHGTTGGESTTGSSTSTSSGSESESSSGALDESSGGEIRLHLGRRRDGGSGHGVIPPQDPHGETNERLAHWHP